MHAEEIASGRLLLNTVGAQRGLTAFLEHNGHWGSAANALQVHRHTMRNRIDAVERLTGRRMDSAQDRHELWLALRARDAARMSSD
jgi:purine catabolism regulator